MLSVLGIDPSLTHTACWHAWGSLDAPSLRGFAIKSRGPKDFPHPLARLRFLRDALAAELERCAADGGAGLAVVEGYAFNARANREALGEWGGLARVLLYERGWSVLLVPPATLKSWCTGSGRGSKGMVAMHVLKRWGHEASDDNDADAHALMRLGLEWNAASEGAAIAKRAADVLKKLERWAAPAYDRPHETQEVSRGEERRDIKATARRRSGGRSRGLSGDRDDGDDCRHSRGKTPEGIRSSSDAAAALPAAAADRAQVAQHREPNDFGKAPPDAGEGRS